MPLQRPLLVPAFALASGIFAAGFASAGVALATGLIGVLAFAAIVVAAASRNHPRGASVALAALALSVGVARLGMVRTPNARDIGSWGGGEGPVVIEGIVDRAPERFGGSGEVDGAAPGSWMVVAVERVEAEGGWREASGRVRVVIGLGTPTIREGGRCRVAGWLTPLRTARNPGEFDFAAWSAKRGIHRMLRVARPQDITGLGTGNRLLALRGAVRERLSRGLAAIGPRGRLYRALVLGDRSGLEAELEDAFVRSGTAHVLAVSGLNLVLVMAMVGGLLRALGAGPRTSGVAAIGLALAYAAVVGWSPPVTRAAAMGACLLGGRLLWRRGDALNALAAAALIVLVINPEDLFGAGFQLSFVAVASLVLASRPIADMLGAQRLRGPGLASRLGKALVGSLAASTAAGLATAPITLLHFNIVCPISLIANLAIVPMASVLLGLGAVAGGLGSIAPGAVQAVAPLFAAPAAAGEWMVRALGAVPGGHVWLPAPHWTWSLAATATGALALWRPRLGGAAALGLATWAALFAIAPRPPEFRAVFLDVGQGACAVLEFPGGDAWVVDCGASARSDPGERVAAPYLWSRRRRTLDALVLTHADMDHISGAASLFERFHVRRLIVTRPFLADPRAAAVLRAADGIPVVAVQAGDVLTTSSGVTLRVLGPPLLTPRWSPNDTSIILHVEQEGLSLLLAGDAETRAVQSLLPAAPHVDVLQVPHHGGSSSRSRELPARSRPAVGVVSARGWFPSPDVEADYAGLGIPLEATYRSGALVFRARGGSWWLERFLDGR